MTDDLPLADYALVGDMRSCALVSGFGRVDWLCLPRHDSPAVFLRLLDPRAGFCAVEPDRLRGAARRYVPDTNVLETTLECEGGTLVVRDFMPVRARAEPAGAGPDCDAEGALVRLIRCARGRVRGRLRVLPTLDYARASPTPPAIEGGTAVFRSAGLALRVAASVGLAADADGGVEAAFDLAEAEEAHLVVAGGDLPEAGVGALLADTLSYWRAWASRCTYRGAFRDAAVRSALCLKLLTYAPTGAIVAAATAGLPEAVGGPRNWDYRYSWLRDASFTVGAFLNLGYRHEPGEYIRFLRGADGSGGRDLKILYPIAGEIEDEQELGHLAGWRGSRPVLIGNGAADQDQNDIYGEFLSALCLYVEGTDGELPEDIRDGLPELVGELIAATERRWQEPDRGIWELRSEPGHFFHSKGMCWLALDSGARLAPRLGLPDADRARWIALRDRIRDEMHDRCWDEGRQTYVAGYELRELDAAVLRCTLFEANDPEDPRLAATISVMEREIVRGPHVYRYRMDDGLEGDEGAFVACSFWLAGNWALQGHTVKAQARIGELVACTNDVGLLSEEVDPVSGEFLGNFPQAFSHMALVNALVRLERCIDRHGLR